MLQTVTGNSYRCVDYVIECKRHNIHPAPYYLNTDKPFLTLSDRYCSPELDSSLGLRVSVYLNLTHALNYSATTAV